MKRSIVAFSGAVLATAAWAVAGPVYNFANITNNNPENLGSQLSVEVNDAGTSDGFSYVAFVFRNAVGIPSSICDVYFDDGTLLGIASISSVSGPNTAVSFSAPANPGDLPGGNAVNFQTSAGFSADSDPPVEHSGVNEAQESLTITFKLLNSRSYADTLAAIAQGSGTASLRIGLHVQAIGGHDGSDSYVNTAVVPLPAAAWMGLALMGSVGGVGYFRSRRSPAQQAL